MAERVYDYFLESAKQFKRIVNLDLYHFIILKPHLVFNIYSIEIYIQPMGAENTKIILISFQCWYRWNFIYLSPIYISLSLLSVILIDSGAVSRLICLTFTLLYQTNMIKKFHFNADWSLKKSRLVTSFLTRSFFT